MKKIIISTLLLFLISNVFSQHSEGDIGLNAGFGLGATLGEGKVKLPPIGISVEYGISDEISLGGHIAYSSYEDEYSSLLISSQWKYSYIIIGARGSYHFAQSQRFDPYVGAFLGYFIGKASASGGGISIESPSVGGLGYSLHLGARYFFSENMGVFAELGYGIAILQTGITFKF